MAGGNGVKGLFRMLRVMSTERWMSAKDIAKASSSPRVTTYSRLKTLASIGVVEKSRRRFREGGFQAKPIYLYRRTIVFQDEGKKVVW